MRVDDSPIVLWGDIARRISRFRDFGCFELAKESFLEPVLV